MKRTQSLNSIIIGFASRRWLAIAALFASLIIGGLLEAFPVGLMQQAVDTIARSSKWSLVVGLVGAWYACRLARSAASLISGVLAGKIGSGLGNEVSQAMFRRLRETSFMRLKAASSSETVSRAVTDSLELGNALTRPLVTIGEGAFIFIWSFAFLARIDALLLAACLPLGVLMLLAGRWVSTLNRKTQFRHKDFRTRAVDCLLETLSGYREIMIFNLWGHQSRVFAEVSRGVAATQQKASALSSGLSSAMDALWPLATVVSLGLGGYRTMTGHLTVGGLLAFMWYVQWVLHPISQIAFYQSEIQSGLVAAQRVQEMLDWFPPRETLGRTVEIHQQLEARGVTFEYEQGKAILRDVNLIVRIGEVVALVGPTGCGKTTLAEVVLGLLKPQSGSLLVDGHRIDSSEVCGSPSIAAVFSESHLFDPDPQANIAMVRAQSGLGLAGMDGAMGVGAEIIEDLLPSSQPNGLSSGQRQCVALAMALARQARILVLDEATSALDTATEEQIYARLSKCRRDIGCLLISHRLSSVIGADRIYVMDNGRIVACGRHEELVSSCDQYGQIYAAQFDLGGSQS
ncbi:MAG TPA: ABC transporter ATP-binding protein [Bacillota bacterium]|jgi:subfamily B ATP-binding cassette protein MsbA